MKRALSILALVLLAAALPLFADEEAEVYRQIYMEADTLQQKYSAALNLIELQDRSLAPVFSDALADLMRTQNAYGQASEKELFARTATLLISALGDFKYDEAAPTLWAVVQGVPDPLAKSEALVALGKMRALPYAERIALMLRDLDIAPGQDRSSDEKVAYGCVLALEKLKDQRGFMPVFYATDAWYSLRIRQQAERSLPNIAPDPTDSIVEIIRNEGVERKIKALKLNASTQAPLERKVQASLVAINVGQTNAPRDKTEEKLLADLKKLAIRSLIAYKATSDEAVNAAIYSYNNGFDDEERLLALQYLGSNPGDNSATALKDIILKLNADQRSGLTDEVRNRMAKAAIENAGATRNKLLRAALLSVSTNDKWSGGIILAAQNALKTLQ
jgi:hypothetical protein